ncbi:MAG: hypothetical protein JWR54_2723 [Mucilaginibacter sp.]|nr:hypothetical protein [Mucilaginibacter sp.]
MENFTTRVQLHNPDEGDYDLLRNEMRESLFYQAVKYLGTWHDLPADEYDCLSGLTTTYIYNLAYSVAKTIIDNKPVNDQQQLKDFWIVVTKADGDRVFKLPKTTEMSKLPPGETL